MERELTAFEESLEDDDWGLIIGNDGSLKGLYIPEGKDDEEVPETIIQICMDVFGIDPTEEVTLH
jgi:hypothetical protein